MRRGKGTLAIAILGAALTAPGCLTIAIGAAAGRKAAETKTRAMMEASGTIRDEGPRMLGLTLNGQLELTSVEPGGPAALEGLLVGDRLLKVDGRPVTTLQQALNKLWGAPGEKVTVQVERAGRNAYAKPRRRCLVDLGCVETHREKKSPIDGGDPVWGPP